MAVGSEKIGEMYVELLAKMNRLEADMRTATRKGKMGGEKVAKGFGARFKSVFKRLNLGATIGAMFGTVAIIAGLKRGANALIDLEKGMRLVNTITRVSRAELKGMRKEVVTLSNEIGTPASELTGAMYQAVSAGVAFADVMGFMKIAAKGAIAGNSDVTTSVDALTTIMNSFKAEGLSTTEVMDIMFKTIELGKTDMNQLSSSYSLAASNASIAGIKFSEFSAAISLITFQGTPTSQALTQINQLIIKMGQELGDGWRKTMTFQEGLQELIKRADGSENALFTMLGSVEAMGGALKLTGENTETFTKFLNQTTTAVGSFNRAFGEMSDSIQNKVEIMQAKFTNFASSMAGDFLEALGLMVKDFETFADIFVKIFDIFNVFGDGANSIEKTTEKTSKNLAFMDGNIRRIGTGLINITKTQKKVNALFDDIGRTVSDINKEIDDMQKIIDNGNISVKTKLDLEADIAKLNKELSGELEKQTRFIEDIINAQGESRTNLDLINEKLKDETLNEEQILALELARLDVLTKISELKIPELPSYDDILGGADPRDISFLKPEGEQPEDLELPDLKEFNDNLEEAFKNAENSTDNIDQKFISILNAGASLSSILEIGAHTFIGVMLAGLDTVNRIANSIMGIISAFTGGGGGGILGLILGGATGGTFKSTGSGITKMAGGGSFLVPQAGQSGDYFPLLLKGGEVANITPANKVIDNTKLLSEINRAINNLNENLVASSGGQSTAILELDGEKIAESVFYYENRGNENSLEKGDFR